MMAFALAPVEHHNIFQAKCDGFRRQFVRTRAIIHRLKYSAFSRLVVSCARYNRPIGGTECPYGISIGDRGYVLETGRLVAEGNPEALWNNDELRAAYLGSRKMVR
jgi:hypothetical protein